ncbi:MAG TPA: hypothetical protein VF116_11230 [Ktedonobacterales bacterium]
MSRSKRTGTGTHTDGERQQRGDGTHVHDTAAEETRALAAFLRELAERAEREPALAARLREALGASGLLDIAGRTRRRTAVGKARTKATTASRRSNRSTTVSGAEPPDPFVLLRERGEAGLREALEGLDLAALRAIVRGHRLDPARISARWTARERVIELIVTQVRGRANLGKAFSRV